MSSLECGLDFGPLVRGAFVRRENRFRTRVRLEEGGGPVAAYLPNPGRLEELLTPERVVLLRPAPLSSQRRTAYDLLLVDADGVWVSVDSRLPNLLVEKLLRCGALAGFEPHAHVHREVTRGESRLDFMLTDGEASRCWLEVKSVTLVEERTAAFPDAPTKRGRRHLRDLRAAVEAGERAVVLFVVQREDAVRFAPHDATDPAFGTVLREVARAGVEVRALRCRVSPQGIRPLGELPVVLESRSFPTSSGGFEREFSYR
ncbi:MAG: DNA/RNA nuclease SfsA [Anaerolineae bacterium]